MINRDALTGSIKIDSYNPVNCSPERFYDLFLEEYRNQPNHSFLGSVKREFVHDKNPVTLLYEGSTVRGIIEEAYAKITISSFSERRTYSRGKSVDIGSVVIASANSRSLKLALRALEDVTQIKLKRVSQKPRK